MIDYPMGMGKKKAPQVQIDKEAIKRRKRMNQLQEKEDIERMTKEVWDA